MKSNKNILICGLIVAIVMAVTLLSGCVQENTNTNGPIEPDFFQLPNIEFEATVVSLSLSNVTTGRGPTDTGIIRVDKIISIDNPDNMSIEGLEEGRNITVEFLYSTRPAKIIREWILVESNDPEDTVSSSFSFSVEDGYFVYTQTSESTTPHENESIVLPGLEVGSKFVATGGYQNEIMQISEYEVLSSY